MFPGVIGGNDLDYVPELAFVMEKDGELIGQNVFVRTAIKADDGRVVPIMTMGPICITPKLKRQGYGKILLDQFEEYEAGFPHKEKLKLPGQLF